METHVSVKRRLIRILEQNKYTLPTADFISPRLARLTKYLPRVLTECRSYVKENKF